MKNVMIFAAGLAVGYGICRWIAFAQRHNGKPAFIQSNTPGIERDPPATK